MNVRLHHTVSVLLTLSVAAALGGCSTTAPLLLADSKPAVQLLRNSAAGTIDPAALQGLTKVDDGSVACDDSDEQERERRWRSSALLELVPEQADQVAELAASTVDSLERNGWTATEDQLSENALAVELVNTDSKATIRITANGDADGNGRGATIFVVVTGECVTTEGLGSAELKTLGE